MAMSTIDEFAKIGAVFQVADKARTVQGRAGARRWQVGGKLSDIKPKGLPRTEKCSCATYSERGFVCWQN